MMSAHESSLSPTGRRALRTIAVVWRHSQPELLDSVVDAGDYEVVFIQSLGHAHSRIKKIAPQMVVICLELDDVEGFQLLSMLKLDCATSRIPVTYVPAPPVNEFEEPWPEFDQEDLRQPIAPSMN
jgi:CheY-like chemotaxis protein